MERAMNSEFGKERLRSLSGFLAGGLALCVVQAHGVIRLGASAYDMEFGSLGRGWSSPFSMMSILFGVTTLTYLVGSVPVWIRHLSTSTRLESFEAWRSSFQAGSGLLLIVFGVFHLGFYSYGIVSEEAMSPAAWTASYLGSSSLIPALYALGLVTLAFHVANGLWRFGVSWGLSTGEKAMGVSTVLCSILFAWTVLTGFETLALFLQTV